MKLSKLNFLTTLLAFIFLTLFLIPACKNSKEPEKDAMTTEVKTTDQPVAVTNPGKRIGKVATVITPADKSSKMETDKAGYYNYTEVAPYFPGGQGSVESYISNNIEYPQEAIDNGAQGTVHVMFTIDENGKVGNARTTGTAIGYGLEEEAIRVVNGMSNWTPGMNKGAKVKSWYTLPITYRLEG